MGKSPRVLFGLARYKVEALLGRTTVPFGFDPLRDPPGTDYTPGDAPAADATKEHAR